MAEGEEEVPVAVKVSLIQTSYTNDTKGMNRCGLIKRVVRFLRQVSLNLRQSISGFYERKHDEKGMNSDKISGSKKGVKCEASACGSTANWL